MDASVRFDTSVVGSLPVVTAMWNQWGLGEIIDSVVRWECEVPLGDLVETLAVCRLRNPLAMSEVGAWAEGAASAVGKLRGGLAPTAGARRRVRAQKQSAKAQPPPAAVLRKYREPIPVERRIHHVKGRLAHVKGPFAAAPMILKTPKRIAGLPCILM